MSTFSPYGDFQETYQENEPDIHVAEKSPSPNGQLRHRRDRASRRRHRHPTRPRITDESLVRRALLQTSDSTSTMAIDWIDAPLVDAGVFVADEVDGWHDRSYTRTRQSIVPYRRGAARERFAREGQRLHRDALRAPIRRSNVRGLVVRSHGNADRASDVR